MIQVPDEYLEVEDAELAREIHTRKSEIEQ